VFVPLTTKHPSFIAYRVSVMPVLSKKLPVPVGAFRQTRNDFSGNGEQYALCSKNVANVVFA
jgi:hypothetical protein